MTLQGIFKDYLTVLIKGAVVLVQNLSPTPGTIPPHCFAGVDLTTIHGFGLQYISAGSLRGTVDGSDVLHGIAALVSCLIQVHLASKEGNGLYATHVQIVS